MANFLSHPILRRLAAVPPAYYVFGLLLLILWLARPNMLNPNVLGIFIRQVVPLGILVLGQLLVMRVKSIDLSGGGIILLINYLITSRTFPEASGLNFIMMALVIGGSVGLLNGYMIAKRRVSAVIVTLAVSIILVGFVQFLSSGKPPGDVPKYMNDIFNISFGAMPLPVLFWVACAGLMWLVMQQSVYGRYVEAVGENAEAAAFSGVPVERTVLIRMCWPD
jgi:ribose transport system permease protein